jgi:hypothetical protein
MTVVWVVLVVACLCWLFASFVSPSRGTTQVVVGVVLVLLVAWIVLTYHVWPLNR